MKVVSQLVRHFWEAGALSERDAEYLLENGLCRLSDVEGFRRRDRWTEADESETPEPYDDCDRYYEELTDDREDRLHEIGEKIVQRTRPGRGPSGRGAHDLDVSALLARLQAKFERRLPNLLALGRLTAPGDDWMVGVSHLRSLRSSKLRKRFGEALDTGEVSLDDLWRATEPDSLRRILSDDEENGRVARAYLASASVNEQGELGKYRWILRYDEVAAAFSLRALHRALAKLLRRMLRHDLERLTRHVSPCREPGLIWSLTLLFNAYRDPFLGLEPRYGVEYGPAALPDERLMQPAWTAAMRMDSLATSAFLVRCYGRPWLESNEGAVFVPKGWHLPDPGQLLDRDAT